jgi:hypothetical protein
MHDGTAAAQLRTEGHCPRVRRRCMQPSAGPCRPHWCMGRQPPAHVAPAAACPTAPRRVMHCACSSLGAIVSLLAYAATGLARCSCQGDSPWKAPASTKATESGPDAGNRTDGGCASPAAALPGSKPTGKTSALLAASKQPLSFPRQPRFCSAVCRQGPSWTSTLH